jgi:hypothetical protein
MMASEVVQEVVGNHTLAILLSVWCGDIKYRDYAAAKHNAIEAFAAMLYVELEA